MVNLIYASSYFLTSVHNVYPEVHAPTPPWDLNLVLQCLTGSLFEPLTMCSLTHLSMNMALLVAITSACSVGVLDALMACPLYTIFFKNKVTLRPLPKYHLHST